MRRRVNLPAADDLFRPTAEEEEAAKAAAKSGRNARELRSVQTADDATPVPRRSSGRVRHDEKMTVYVTSDELLDLEHARLALRRDHGLAIDRGRLVREAITMALADLDEHGAKSGLAKRLLGTDS